MNTEKTLKDFLPKKGITVISGYHNQNILVYVALYELISDNCLKITFPKCQDFDHGQAVTLHLDNRTGVDEFDTELRVFRMSYKGKITESGKQHIIVEPVEFTGFYSNRTVITYTAPDYEYETITGFKALEESDITHADLHWTGREHENKVGIFITGLKSQPHTSLMAFLSTEYDDIFLITLKNMFKYKVIHQESRCCFAIDHRSDFVFEKAYDWNYTIIQAKAYAVSKENPVFHEIQERFVEKNPWEASFFLSPDVELYHLKPLHILMSDNQ